MEATNRQVLSYDAARKMNDELFSAVIAQFDDWLARLRQLTAHHEERLQAHNIDWDRLLKATEACVTISVAMFSTRYGIGDKLETLGFRGYDHLEYHNTQHALDIIARLETIFAHYGLETFPPQRQILLVLFALFHDLRQQEPGAPVGGIGANERASADEAEAILRVAFEHAGFDLVEDSELLRYFVDNNRLMIFGTTFNFVSKTDQMENPFTGEEGSYTIPVGALAPMIIGQLKEAHTNWKSDPKMLETFENILLGADVDTANVSDSFYDFAVQGVNLCREIEKRKGNLRCEPAAVYNFMTAGQEYYFHVAQQYNSRFSRELLVKIKEDNGAKLAQLTRQIRDTYGNPEDDCKTLKTDAEGKPLVPGETILDDYLAGARRLNANGSG